MKHMIFAYIYIHTTVHIWYTFMNIHLILVSYARYIYYTLRYMCDMTHSYVCHDAFMYAWLKLFISVTFLETQHMHDMSHSYVWHDSFMYVIYVTGLIHTWQNSCMYVTRLIHTCDMTHSYMWHDSFIHVTWLIHTCDITRSMSIAQKKVQQLCDMTYSYVWHDSFTGSTCAMANAYAVTWLVDRKHGKHSYELVVSHVRTSQIAQTTHEWSMSTVRGWWCMAHLYGVCAVWHDSFTWTA